MLWFWVFIFYSMAGYGLEKLYAIVTRARHRVRKCFLLLPLCPVYGLAMAAVLWLAGDTEDFWQLALYGGVLSTAVEYAVHFLYEKCLGVMFWDYSGTHLDLNRRICFPFAVAWGVLSAVAVQYVQPKIEPILTAISPEVTLAAVLLLTADSFFTVRLLHRGKDIDLLSVRNLWRALHQM